MHTVGAAAAMSVGRLPVYGGARASGGSAPARWRPVRSERQQRHPQPAAGTRPDRPVPEFAHAHNEGRPRKTLQRTSYVGSIFS